MWVLPIYGVHQSLYGVSLFFGKLVIILFFLVPHNLLICCYRYLYRTGRYNRVYLPGGLVQCTVQHRTVQKIRLMYRIIDTYYCASCCLLNKIYFSARVIFLARHSETGVGGKKTSASHTFPQNHPQTHRTTACGRMHDHTTPIKRNIDGCKASETLLQKYHPFENQKFEKEIHICTQS